MFYCVLGYHTEKMCVCKWLCKGNIILKYTFMKFSALHQMTFIIHVFWVILFNTSLPKAAPFHELMSICLNYRKIQNNVNWSHRSLFLYTLWNINTFAVTMKITLKCIPLFLTAKKTICVYMHTNTPNNIKSWFFNAHSVVCNNVTVHR